MSLRRSGIISVILGTIVQVYGEIVLNTVTYNCPVVGCTGVSQWQYNIPFFAGPLLSIIGVIFLVSSELMKDSSL